jgi:hypothetical protein
MNCLGGSASRMGQHLHRRDPKTAGGACKILGIQAEPGYQLVVNSEKYPFWLSFYLGSG